MIKIIIGIVIGAGGVYALLNGTDNLEQKARGAVHGLASEVAEATEPTAQEQVKGFFSDFVGK